MKAIWLCLIAVVGLLAVNSLPVQAGDAAAGRKKAAACQICHGLDGVAKIPFAPHIAGENILYLQAQLKAFRSGKRKHDIMSLVAASLSDEDISDLAAWYASIEFSVTGLKASSGVLLCDARYRHAEYIFCPR